MIKLKLQSESPQFCFVGWSTGAMTSALACPSHSCCGHGYTNECGCANIYQRLILTLMWMRHIYQCEKMSVILRLKFGAFFTTTSRKYSLQLVAIPSRPS